MLLRVGLNVARQELFFDKPFLTSVDQTDDRTSSDAVWYISGAKAFLNGKGICSANKGRMTVLSATYFDDDMNWRKIDENYFSHKSIPPLYPLFLACCFFVGGFNVLAYFIPQIVLGSLTCVLIYLISEKIFNRAVALFAGLIMVFNLDLIFWAGFARTETLFIFLFVSGFWLLLKGNSERNLFLIYGSAAIFGLACLTRITFTPFLFILFIWQIFSFSKNRKENFKIAFVASVITFAVLLPWGIRNYLVFGEFNVFSNEAEILIESAESGEQYEGVDINNGYALYDLEVLKTLIFIKDNFKEYLTSCWRRFVIFWSPFTHVMRSWAKIYKGVSWFIIFPAAFWGIIASRRKWGNGALLIAVFIFYYAFLHSASFMDLGLIYRYPILPFLCIFAGYTYNAIYENIKNRIEKKNVE